MIWKFRAQCFFCKQWHYGAVIDDNQFIIVKEENIAKAIKRIRPETVGVFINRYDKNGKEIYTGDVLEWFDPVERDAPEKLNVVWCEPLGAFLLESLDGAKASDTIDFIDFHLHSTVIGNVHDNPELVEVDER